MTTSDVNRAAATESPLLPNRSTRDRLAFGFVLLVTAVMLTAALALVGMYGYNIPTWDDWDIVPTATGHRPVTMQWLWSQHNEHRVAVPRLLQLAMMKFIAMDLRVGMVFNVLVLGGLSFGLVFTARRLRGYSTYSDAFFPLVLLNWSHSHNWLWSWQVQYLASVLLTGVTLILSARFSSPPKFVSAVTAGVCIVLLPLCGANGLGLVPALAVWLGYIAVLQRRGPGRSERHGAFVTAALSVASLLLVGLYFVGYSAMPYFPVTHDWRHILIAASKFLTIGFGPAAAGLFFDGGAPMFFWPAACLAVVALFLVSGAVLLRAWWREPEQRVRAAGLFFHLAAIGSLALGLGVSRSGFETRYATLAAPGLCAIYLVWTAYGSAWMQRGVTTTMCVTAAILFLPNSLGGLRWAQYLQSQLVPFEADLRAGTQQYKLLQKYASMHQDNEMMMDYMPMLRGAGVGAFTSLRDDPPFREIALPLTPVDVSDMEWSDSVGRSTKDYAYLTFTLPSDVEVSGIRLDYTNLEKTGVAPFLGLAWKSSDEADFGEASHLDYNPFGDRSNWRNGTWLREKQEAGAVHVWVDRPVRTVRVRVIGPATFRIHRLVVLVPAE